jgi:hypothetical protein
VIQDDALVCRNFAGAVDAISYSNPDVPVVLFLGGFPQGTAGNFRKALMRKERYIWLMRSPIVPLVAVLWPKAKAQEFLDWEGKTTRADDGNAGRWHKETNQQIRVCVPSLVEHPDMVPSVKGGQKAHWGRDRMRVAVSFAENGLMYEW